MHPFFLQHFQIAETDIESHTSVEDALDLHFADKFEPDQYNCDKCAGKNIEATQKLVLKEAPFVVFIHLKRFLQDDHGIRSKENN